MTKLVLTTVLLASVLSPLMFIAPVSAEDTLGTWDAKERFQVRLRAIDVIGKGEGHVKENNLPTQVDHAIVPEVDLTYFFTKNIAAELIAATSEHNIRAGNLNLGDAMILPPTLTLQYHFTPDEKFSPYVGAGVNYSYFYSEDPIEVNKLDVDGGFGFAVQAGADYWLNDNWGVNFDVKYVDLNVDVTVNGGSLNARDVKLDPWIVGAGVSYRF